MIVISISFHVLADINKEEDTAEQADMQPFVRSVLQRCPR
jgi:hypothetical protein